jgi:hypothetical protein
MRTESDTIWYSRLSTGIFEVDLQHSNIDILIELLEKLEDKAKIKIYKPGGCKIIGFSIWMM